MQLSRLQVDFIADLHLHSASIGGETEVPDEAKGRLLACVQALPALNGTSIARDATLSWASQVLAPISDTSPASATVQVSILHAHAAVQPACEPGVTLSETMQAATSTLALDLDLLLAGIPEYDGLSVRPRSGPFEAHRSSA